MWSLSGPGLVPWWTAEVFVFPTVRQAIPLKAPRLIGILQIIGVILARTHTYISVYFIASIRITPPGSRLFLFIGSLLFVSVKFPKYFFALCFPIFLSGFIPSFRVLLGRVDISIGALHWCTLKASRLLLGLVSQFRWMFAFVLGFFAFRWQIATKLYQSVCGTILLWLGVFWILLHLVPAVENTLYEPWEQKKCVWWQCS